MAKRPEPAERKTRKRAADAAPLPSVVATKAGRKSAVESAVAEAAKTGKSPKRSSPAPLRRPPRKTFLVAVTIEDADGAADLRVYAAVTRMPAEALDAVRGALGPEVSVELTGKLSGRMAKALKLKAGDVRRI